MLGNRTNVTLREQCHPEVKGLKYDITFLPSIQGIIYKMYVSDQQIILIMTQLLPLTLHVSCQQNTHQLSLGRCNIIPLIPCYAVYFVWANSIPSVTLCLF